MLWSALPRASWVCCPRPLPLSLPGKPHLVVQLSQQHLHGGDKCLIVPLGLQQEAQLHEVFLVQVQVLRRLHETQKQGGLCLLSFQILDFLTEGRQLGLNPAAPKPPSQNPQGALAQKEPGGWPGPQ